MINLNSEPRDIEAAAERAKPLDPPEMIIFDEASDIPADAWNDKAEFDEDSWKDHE